MEKTNEIKIGSRVKYIGYDGGKRHVSLSAPPVGTVGMVVAYGLYDEVLVRWPDGTTSAGNGQWYCCKEYLESVDDTDTDTDTNLQVRYNELLAKYTSMNALLLDANNEFNKAEVRCKELRDLYRQLASDFQILSTNYNALVDENSHLKSRLDATYGNSGTSRN